MTGFLVRFSKLAQKHEDGNHIMVFTVETTGGWKAQAGGWKPHHGLRAETK